VYLGKNTGGSLCVSAKKRTKNLIIYREFNSKAEAKSQQSQSGFFVKFLKYTNTL